MRAAGKAGGDQPPAPVRKRITVGGWLWPPVLFGLYLLLVDTWIVPELLAALGTTVLAVGVAALLRRGDCLRIRIRPRWLRAAGGLPQRVARDLAAVAAALAGGAVRGRRASGRVVREPLPRSANSRLAAGYRAMLTELSSTPPGSVVLEADPGQGWVVLHRLGRSRGSSLLPPEGRDQ